MIPNGEDADTGNRVFELKEEAFIPDIMEGELSEELDEQPMHQFVFVTEASD
jgi:hypothetical protein